MILNVGDTGVDFSFARPPAQRLLDLGYSFIVGYISVYPSAPAKNITHAELDAYEAAGLDTLLVWEMSATRANLGAKYGTQDGANARIEALNRDYPEWKPILAADDTNTTAVNIDAQEEYMRAFAKACSPYPIGIYGDIDILTRCIDLWVLGWMPNAWAWSGSSRAEAEAKAKAIGVHVLQRKGFYIDNTWAVDPNEVIKAVAFNPPVPNPQPEDDMPAFISNKFAGKYGAAPSPQGGCTIWELTLSTKRHLGFFDWVGYGMPFGVACDDATLDGIPDWAPDGDPATAARLAKLETVTVALNDAVGRTGQTVGDIQMNLIKAGGG